eukprot:GHVP01068804.1.p1 GENE.GHVP01068804.1~~GHVP01068804.1.p1  ORF type:complete len:495 (+),score=78.90 GHVP01068804.1:29-1513(+)
MPFGKLLLVFLCVSAFPYCSELNFEQRKPPLLDHRSLELNPELVHVSVLARHGARIPQTSKKCFDETPIDFMCNSKSNEVFSYPGLLQAMKSFDVNTNSNFAKGTCESGSLLPAGRYQHRLLGKLFREAYLEENKTVHNGRPLLKGPNVLRKLYVRATDMERTRQSALEFVTSFLEGMDLGEERLVVHTVDFLNDYIYPNSIVCPVLKEIQREAFLSKEFSELKKKYSRAIEKVQEYSFLPESAFPSPYFDCLIVPLCMGFALPRDLQPGSEYFDEIWEAMQDVEGFYFRYRSGMFSTISMRGLMNDIRQHLTNVVIPLTDSSYQRYLKKSSKDLEGLQPQDIVLSFLHDSSLYAILVFLLEQGHPLLREWPPYASTLVFEVYKIDDDLVSRVIYNGQLLTKDIRGCNSKDSKLSEEFCSLHLLFKLLDVYLLADPCDHSLKTIDRNPATYLGDRVFLNSGQITPLPSFILVFGVAATLAGLYFTKRRNGGQLL